MALVFGILPLIMYSIVFLSVIFCLFLYMHVRFKEALHVRHVTASKSTYIKSYYRKFELRKSKFKMLPGVNKKDIF